MPSQEIHDMIQRASVEPTRDSINAILNILDAMNTRMDEIESVAKRTQHEVDLGR